MFPYYYEETLKNWPTITYVAPTLPSITAFQVPWYNKYIKIDKKTFYKPKITKKLLNFVGQHFKEDGKTKSWNDLQ